MALRGRKILKEFFSDGRRPSEQEFEDLIDSSVNRLDDGYSKNSKDGLKLSPKDEKGILMSFCAQSGTEPSWFFSIDNEKNLLIYQKTENSSPQKLLLNSKEPPSLVLKSPKTVIEGDIELHGIKKGQSVSDELQKELVADGKWHDVTTLKDGVYVLEIVASIQGAPGDGEYAVLMGWATHAFGSHKKIKTVGSHYGFWGHKLKMRWYKKKEENNNKTFYQLQIKSRLRYKDKSLPITCHITYLHKYEKSDSKKA